MEQHLKIFKDLVGSKARVVKTKGNRLCLIGEKYSLMWRKHKKAFQLRELTKENRTAGYFRNIHDVIAYLKNPSTINTIQKGDDNG
jgi:hypothetical protein